MSFGMELAVSIDVEHALVRIIVTTSMAGFFWAVKGVLLWTLCFSCGCCIYVFWLNVKKGIFSLTDKLLTFKNAWNFNTVKQTVLLRDIWYNNFNQSWLSCFRIKIWSRSPFYLYVDHNFNIRSLDSVTDIDTNWFCK